MEVKYQHICTNYFHFHRSNNPSIYEIHFSRVKKVFDLKDLDRTEKQKSKQAKYLQHTFPTIRLT